ncbi:MAG: DUF523 domain-containing protein [Actinomycetota bacterium]
MKRLKRNDERILGSGCLAGLPCSHDGRDRLYGKVKELVSEGKGIPACPEQLGGRPTPREATELDGGDGNDVIDGRARALTKSGVDVTGEFLEGAERTLRLAKRHGCRQAILKARSPSCGSGKVYDGTFSGGLKDGDGVAAALLKREGIEVLTEEDI